MAKRTRRIAVIGAGPIGLEAALEATRRGLDVTIYDAGRVGEHLRRFGHVTLFTPFGMSSTPLGRETLRTAGVGLPPEDGLLTASDLVERYLEPLARLPELRGRVRERHRVTHVTRDGIAKGEGVAGIGGPDRARHPFLLRVVGPDATCRFERADAVLDASGVYACPNATGPGGVPAPGEDGLGDRLERDIPSIPGADRDRFSGARVLLIGDGHSAATALVQLAGLERAGAAPPRRVDWIHRARAGDRVFQEIADDPLPARTGLARTANDVARSAGWLTAHPGASVLSYENGAAGTVLARLRSAEAEEREVEVDRVLALVGYRPDLSLARELQIHLCYASEGPMKLAAALLAAARTDPDRAGDCLAQVAHGPESLRNPEPGYFVLGAKSYARNPAFLLSIGHRQVHDALSLMSAEAPFQTAASTTAR